MPIKIDKEKCTGCGTCVETCPNEAIELKDNIADVDPEKCVECGVCVDNCPAGAIT